MMPSERGCMKPSQSSVCISSRAGLSTCPSLWLGAFGTQIGPLDRFDRLRRSRLTASRLEAKCHQVKLDRVGTAGGWLHMFDFAEMLFDPRQQFAGGAALEDLADKSATGTQAVDGHVQRDLDQ